MDVEILQGDFTMFVQSLFALGYLDDGFRSLYVTNGLPTDLDLVTNSMTLTSVNIESVLETMKFKLDYSLDFPPLTSHTADIHSNAERLGAARVKRLNEDLRACSNIQDRDRCFWCIKMLDFELKAVMSALSDVFQLRKEIEKCGASIPLDW